MKILCFVVLVLKLNFDGRDKRKENDNDGGEPSKKTKCKEEKNETSNEKLRSL